MKYIDLTVAGEAESARFKVPAWMGRTPLRNLIEAAVQEDEEEEEEE
jgi:hypothetical protein